MRSQATKTLPKKGVLVKPSFKQHSPTKQVKKKPVSSKNLHKLLKKTSTKCLKKKTTKIAVALPKKDEKTEFEEASEFITEVGKAGPSKSPVPARSISPTKKIKNVNKDQKPLVKKSVNTSIKRKNSKLPSPKSVKKTQLCKTGDTKSHKLNEVIKYKINVAHVKKKSLKCSKLKALVKKVSAVEPKKIVNASKTESTLKEPTKSDQKDESCELENNEGNSDKHSVGEFKQTADDRSSCSDDKNSNDKLENTDGSSCQSSSCASLKDASTAKTPPRPVKVETDRPLKFFTSTRSPRTVDIDVKSCKTTKASINISERFLSIKSPDLKSDDSIKSKVSNSNNLLSQESEVDVYTFTDYKADSPKNILPDFRSPVSRNVGRVRPIARVKGTVVDKTKPENEKKKYSPNRPIEEVVKQLKAGKEAKQPSQPDKMLPLNVSCTVTSNSTQEQVKQNVVENTSKKDDEPKGLVSKSYKMVARKTSIPGQSSVSSTNSSKESEVSSVKSESPRVKTIKTTKKLFSSKKIQSKKQLIKPKITEDEIDLCKFALNTDSTVYSSSDESQSDSNYTGDSSRSGGSIKNKSKTKKYKKNSDIIKKNTSKELKNLSSRSSTDTKENALLLGEDKPSKRRLKLLSMWTGPKKHRMASLNAIAKVHCLYENESRTHMELGLMRTVDKAIPSTSKTVNIKKKVTKTEKQDSSTSESEYEKKVNLARESSEDDSCPPSTRTLRVVPGSRGSGKYWDHKSSTSSSEDSEMDYKNKIVITEKKKPIPKPTSTKTEVEKAPVKMKKTTGVPVKKKRNRHEVVMDLKDMVVQKRMASLNATAILAASYEKRSSKSSKEETTSDSWSDGSFCQKPKNVTASGVKSEVTKIEECKKEIDDSPSANQKVEVIVNQDTDVTITGVYSTHHHEGFCTVSGLQYRISATSHTQTTATSSSDKELELAEGPDLTPSPGPQESGAREEDARYTPLSALSSMQPPAEHQQQPHPVGELGGLGRRAGCSSAFSAPSPAAHHDPGYYQPAGPLIKESGAEAERALSRYHPPHYHPPHPPPHSAHQQHPPHPQHPPVLQQYGSPYYSDLCYGGYYRGPAPHGPAAYHLPAPQPDAQMVNVAGEPYPPRYYGPQPCYQHPPQRVPYIPYRGCPCPMNACPKNVLIGPATGKPPTSGGPNDALSVLIAPPGGAFRPKARAARALGPMDVGAQRTDTIGSGKDPPLEPDPPAAADAPHPGSLPVGFSGVSPKRELYENIRDAGDTPGPAEAVGSPSPARGSAGACAPQPPPAAQRRARLGKAMARKFLVGEDTGTLLSAPQPPQPAMDMDDDVVALSSPETAPIDLSSSDETERRPLEVDVKKENEGPIIAPARNPDAHALREHNSTTQPVESSKPAETTKAVKRRYSRPKLEIDLREPLELDSGRQTNCIGEHVKLQKRRKVTPEATEVQVRAEVPCDDESKKKIMTPKIKRSPKTPNSSEKKGVKRKSNSLFIATTPKRLNLDTPPTAEAGDLRPKDNVESEECRQEKVIFKPKHKAALLLDKLIRKNSIDRGDTKEFDSEIDPAELFLPPTNTPQNGIKKLLNINNNIVSDATAVNGIKHSVDIPASQFLVKKLTQKQPVSKITLKPNDVDAANALSTPCISEKISAVDTDKDCLPDVESKDDLKPTVTEKTVPKVLTENIQTVGDTVALRAPIVPPEKPKPKISDTLLAKFASEKHSSKLAMTGKTIEKPLEKTVKLLVQKRPPVETVLTVSGPSEEAAPAPPAVAAGRRPKRRRSGGRRLRRPAAPALEEPVAARSTPRWSNGWTWEGEPYLSTVYLNNDSRLDRRAWCWPHMAHAGGDRVTRGDCVMLRAASRSAQPFVARVARLWENPDDGEMMLSLLWYYRPEHTEMGRLDADASDEVFASGHRDANSVACIEDKCYVLTYNEYCRYRKRLKAAEEGIKIVPSMVPTMPVDDVPPTTNDARLPATISQELVLFCRKIYDFRSKKIQIPTK